MVQIDKKKSAVVITLPNNTGEDVVNLQYAIFELIRGYDYKNCGELASEHMSAIMLFIESIQPERENHEKAFLQTA